MDQESPRRWPRRAVLRTAVAFGVAIPAVAAGAVVRRQRDSAAPAPGATPAAPVPSDTAASRPPSSTATPSATPTPTATPTATPTPPPPAAIEFRPRDLGPGEATLLLVHAAEPRGQARFLGQTLPLRKQGDLLWAILGVPIDTELGPRTVEITLQDGAGQTTQRVSATATVVAVERPVDYLVVADEVQSLLTPQAGITEEQLRAKEFSAFDPDARWQQLFVPPAPGPVSTQFGSGRSVNGGPVGGFHTGADIANDQGTPVVAAAPGRVAYVENHPIRGLTVIVDHGLGVKSGYHHLEAALVRPDDMVETGTLIARMGTSGYSTGPHLHWELTVYGVNVDPFTWTRTSFRP